MKFEHYAYVDGEAQGGTSCLGAMLHCLLNESSSSFTTHEVVTS